MISGFIREKAVYTRQDIPHGKVFPPLLSVSMLSPLQRQAADVRGATYVTRGRGRILTAIGYNHKTIFF